MTDGLPDSDENANRENETESDSGPDLVKVEPRPEKDSSIAQDSVESDDSGEGEDIAEADDSGDDDETDEEDDEPRLKYVRLTQHLNAVYRADMTSAFIVAGDKMIIGTHGGNIVR
jgi:vacuolar protein sorting-associated protein 41